MINKESKIRSGNQMLLHRLGTHAADLHDDSAARSESLIELLMRDFLLCASMAEAYGFESVD